MPHDRRAEILTAALAAFLERGYLATTLADIRRLSGASTGSIYHFFDGKPALALALLGEATAGWSAAAPVDPDAGAEAAIRASVSGLVAWGLENPGHLRLMDELRTLAATTADSGFGPLRTALEAGNTAAAARYAQWTQAGAVRPLPWPLARALILGPAYEFLRFGQPMPDAPARLAEAAWQAIRAP